MDMSMESTSQKTSSRSAVSKDMELQVCVCGWSKATTVRGLKIHQGRMKCLREKGQGPRIDQYFLRSQSSQSNEIQRQEANHSSQDISTPVIDVRRTCMDTVSDEPNDPCEPDLSAVASRFRPQLLCVLVSFPGLTSPLQPASSQSSMQIITPCGSLASSGVVDDVTDQEVTETKTVDGRMKLDAAAFSEFINKQNKKI
ncbi:UNVERIFIED_CONTAM: hypothetical protein FKN15_033912 [Acipenser sinensis]